MWQHFLAIGIIIRLLTGDTSALEEECFISSEDLEDAFAESDIYDTFIENDFIDELYYNDGENLYEP